MFKSKHLHVDHARATFPLPWYGPKARLHVRCAHDTVNPQLQVERTTARDRALEGVDTVRGTVSPDAASELRRIDRSLYAKHVIDGWDGVLGADDREVEYSREAAAILLSEEHMPDWIFDQLRLFAMRPANFIAVVDPSPAQMKAVVGNSSGA